MTVEHFVIMAGRPKRTDTEVFVITAPSPGRAHDFAADRYRQDLKLASNIHVITATLFRSEDEEEATIYYACLINELIPKKVQELKKAET